MRKTKIVCTIGPACSDENTLTEMCRAGMNVARLNFSHGTHEDHLAHMEKLKRIREKLKLPIAILLDTKGPEYRIRTFRSGKVTLAEGDTFTFTTDESVIGDETRVAVSYAGLADDLEAGDIILLNNGLLAFRVTEIRGGEVVTTVTTGGELSDRKSMSFPGKVLNQVYLSEQDKDDIRFGLENGVDFIACSFVSCRQDLIDVKNFLRECGDDGTELIAKIENRAGIENIEEICEECSGIMIGRGDMGVEIPFEELPSIQKQLITSCRLLGKRVITATEMLESMIHNRFRMWQTPSTTARVRSCSRVRPPRANTRWRRSPPWRASPRRRRKASNTTAATAPMNSRSRTRWTQSRTARAAWQSTSTQRRLRSARSRA